MRLIDADKLESGEVIIPTENGGYEYVEVFYKDDVDNAPTVEAEPIRHGHWIEEKSIGDCCYKCSNCGFIRDAYLLEIENYCPNCGARMDEEVNT